MDQVKITQKETLSQNWYKLYKYTFEIIDKKGKKHVQEREAYDRGNGAVILLYNKVKGTVILTRQFRLPTFVNGNSHGMMIEACAGLLDDDNPEDCIRRETEEETGYRISHVKKIYEAYMSPGSVTEILHFFIGEYDENHKVNEGGGVDEEEMIEVMEMPFNEAMSKTENGEIKDAKTIMLIQYLRLNQIM